MATSPTSAEELKADLEELRELRSRSSRQRVRDHLDLYIRRVETDLQAALEASNAADGSKAKPASSDSSDSRVFTLEIKTYAWDQTDKYFKLYVSEGLAGVGALEPDRVKAEFTETSVRLLVRGLGGRDRELRVPRLYERILPAESSIRVKADQVVVLLRKAACSTWVYVTEAERKSKEEKTKKAKKPAVDEADPNAGLMNLMRQMYEDGDDEMKRTIAKAWTESQGKRGTPVD